MFLLMGLVEGTHVPFAPSTLQVHVRLDVGEPSAALAIGAERCYDFSAKLGTNPRTVYTHNLRGRHGKAGPWEMISQNDAVNILSPPLNKNIVIFANGEIIMFLFVVQ